MLGFINSPIMFVTPFFIPLAIDVARFRTVFDTFYCQMSEVEQYSVIKFLWKEGCPAQDIHARLHAVYGATVDTLPSVYFWIKEFRCGRENIGDQPCSGRPTIDNLDADIMCVLDHSPFETVRSIAEEVGVSATIVHRRLTESVELRPRFVKGLPHLQACDLKTKRVELAREFLETLRSEEHTLFDKIIPVDESWFYLDYSSGHIWTCASNDVPQRVSHQIRSEKLVLTMLWSTRGPIVVKWMGLGQRFHSTYFIDEIVSESVPNIKRTWNFPDNRWYRLHLDDARPHNSRSSVEYIDRNKFVRLSHPPRSPGLAPADFYLF
jgi:histone-lysine N-methyltransferase SETMAR